MKNNNFEAEYARYEELDAAYDAADKTNNEMAMEKARADYHKLEEDLLAKGDGYFRMFERYKSARQRGNDYIDLSETIWDNQVPGLIEDFRTYGIEAFTFSSTWSSAVEIAWLFQQNGCSLAGLIEINSQYTSFRKNDYEKAPAYLFRVN